MTEPSEPAFTLEELTDRQKQVIEALDTAIRGMHAKLGITSSEAVGALTAVAYHIVMAQAMQYYEIEMTAPEGQP